LKRAQHTDLNTTNRIIKLVERSLVLRFTRLGVVLVVTAWQLELRKRAHV